MHYKLGIQYILCREKLYGLYSNKELPAVNYNIIDETGSHVLGRLEPESPLWLLLVWVTKLDRRWIISRLSLAAWE